MPKPFSAESEYQSIHDSRTRRPSISPASHRSFIDSICMRIPSPHPRRRLYLPYLAPPLVSFYPLFRKRRLTPRAYLPCTCPIDTSGHLGCGAVDCMDQGKSLKTLESKTGLEFRVKVCLRPEVFQDYPVRNP